MDLLEFTGIWWLPNKEDNTVSGTLTISFEEGFRLKLIGHFVQGDNQNIFGSTAYSLIVGISQNGQQITITDCVQVGFNRAFSGAGNFTQQEFYIGGAVYIGTHFYSEPNEIRFNKVQVGYSHLQEWADLFKPQVEFKEEEYNLKFSYPDKRTVSLHGGSLSLAPNFEASQNNRQVSFKQTMQVEFEMAEALNLREWLSRYIVPVQNFLSLATQKPNAIESIVGFKLDEDIDEQAGEEEEKKIQVIFPRYYSKKDTGEILLPQKMLFSYDDIYSDFPQLIEKWLIISDELRSVLNLFFAVQYNEKLYLENKFLNIIQAAETYHRRRYKENSQGEEHQKRLVAILTAIPEEYKNWLEKKLQFSPEPSLSQRLKQLIREVDIVVRPLFRRKDSFVQRVVDTRNFFTHYDPSREAQAAKEESLFIMTQTISLLVQACLLRELGISNEKSVEFFQRSEMYNYVLSKK